MKKDEIVTALRCCGNCDVNECKPCPLRANAECQIKLTHAAANLIENQLREIDALMKANDSLAGYGTDGKGCGDEGGTGCLKRKSYGMRSRQGH